MAFKASTINGNMFGIHPQTQKPHSFIEPGPGANIEIDGVAFTGFLGLFAGEGFVPLAAGENVATWNGFGRPTKAMLANDKLHIETMHGEPWPGSVWDRAGKREGKDRMMFREFRGEWPTADERAHQRNAHARLADPKEFVRRLGKALGNKQADIDLRVAMVDGGKAAISAPDLGFGPEEVKKRVLAKASA